MLSNLLTTPITGLMLFALVQTPPAAKAPQDAHDPKVASDVNAKLDRFLVDSGYAGCVLVAKDGKILLEKGYGEADHEKHVPFKTDTLVSLGSITKQFTAAAILKLEMEGKLKVEDPISRFFPDAPEDKRAITLHQLLTHTSGLESDFAKDYDAVGRDEYVRRILSSKLRTAPGAEHFYANAGYSLLAAIVELVSKQSYEAYLHEHVFEPAGMHETGYKLPKWDMARAPVGYSDGKRWGTMFERPWAEDGPYWALRGNGGIESTLDDMWKWSRVLEGESVLSAAAKKKMFTPHVKESPQGDSYYGYGSALFTTPWGTRLIAHDGGNGVFSADFRRYVDDGIVVITFSSDSGIKAWRYSGPLGRIVHGDDVAPLKSETAKLAALGDSTRHVVIKKFLEAFNTNELARIQSFRAENMASRPGGPSEEERDRMAKRMFDEMQHLTSEGVLAEADDSVTVRMKTGLGETVRFQFGFTADNKVNGIRVEAGD